MTDNKSTALDTTGPREVQVGSYALSTIIKQQLWKSDELAKVANIVFPVTALDQLPPMHKPSLSVIRVDTDMRKKEVYSINSDQLGLSKHIILKMLNATGANVKTQKLTPDSDLDLIRWAAIVWGKLPDGTVHQAQASKAWSWEKCQAEMKENQAKQYRQFADEQTETKAILRAARAFLNIKTSYSKEELAKPFIIARSVPDMDMSDPEIRRMYAQRLIDSTFALYGDASAAPALPPSNLQPVPDEPDPSEFEEDNPFRGIEPDSGTYSGKRNEPDPESVMASAEAVTPEEYDPFAEPTEEEKQAIMRQELLDNLKARCMDLHVPNESLRALCRDIRGSADGEPTPSIPELTIDELRTLTKRLEERS
jgi:hypothetical protein